MDLCLALQNLSKFSSNTGKVHVDVLVHLLRYIRDNNNSGLRYFANIEDAHISDLFRQAILNTEKQFMVFSDYIYQYCPYNKRRTGSYIVFYQGGKIDHCTHVPGPVAHSSDESDYNETCTTGMALAHFRM